MDHSVKSVVLLQDQLLQIFFNNLMFKNAPKKQNNINEKLKITTDIPIKETSREKRISKESNQMEVHNVFDEKQASLESVLSQKPVEKEKEEFQGKAESDEEMEFHDIYEARNSRSVMVDEPKKNVFINLKENLVIGKNENQKSIFKEEKEEAEEEEEIVKPSFGDLTEEDLVKIKDRLTILVIAYHNFAVELEYLGGWRD